MYYLAIFKNDDDFLYKKISSFMKNGYINTYFSIRGKSQILSSAGDISNLTGVNFENNFWVIYGTRGKKVKCTDGWKRSLCEKTSFDKMNQMFLLLAEKYSWAIIPWCGTDYDNCLLFISGNKNLRDKFVSCCSNIHQPFPEREDLYNLLISEYEIDGNIESKINALLYWESDEAFGNGIWDICNCSNNNPYIVYNKFQKDGSNQQDVMSWYTGDYSVIETFNPFECIPTPAYPSSSLSKGAELSLYRIHNADTFANMVKCIMLDNTITFIVLPHSVELNKLPRLIRQFDGFPLYNDLLCIDNILDYCEWFYAPGRGHVDDLYSLFISKKRALLANLSTYINENKKHFDLISCF